MAPEWLQALALNGSHIAYLLPIAIALYSRRWFSAAVIAAMTITSLVYHLCLSDLVCVQPLLPARIQDYVGVSDLAVYYAIRLHPLPDSVVPAVWVLADASFRALGVIMVRTLTLPILMAVLAFTGTTTRFVVKRWDVPDASVAILAFLVATIATGAVMFFVSDSVYDATYWWAHSIWHVVTALFLAAIELFESGIFILPWVVIGVTVNDVIDTIAIPLPIPVPTSTSASAHNLTTDAFMDVGAPHKTVTTTPRGVRRTFRPMAPRMPR